MSQSGLLSEEEIKSYLSESLNIKLDREYLIKPSRETICEIYLRILNDSFPQWSKPRKSASPSEEPVPKAMMVGWIKHLIGRYNIGFTFTMNDLLMPTRKRTTAFLNVLIFIREQAQEQSAMWQRWEEDWTIQKTEANRFDQLLAQARLELENLAIKKSTSKPIDKLVLENREKNIMFTQYKYEGENFADEVQKVKNDIKSVSENNEIKKKQNELLDAELQDLDETLQSLNDGRSMKKKIIDLEQMNEKKTEDLKNLKKLRHKASIEASKLQRLINIGEMCDEEESKTKEFVKSLLTKFDEDRYASEKRFQQANETLVKLQAEESALREQLTTAERNRSKKKLQIKIKEEQKQLELESRIARRKETTQERVSAIEELKSRIESKKRERADAAAKLAEDSKMCEKLIAKANMDWDILRKENSEFQQSTKRSIESITHYRQQLDLLFGKPKEKEIEMPAANRTYIKELGSENMISNNQ